MRAIDGRPVAFGELSGPLVHGSTLFDWQVVALQAFAAAVDHPFESIVAEGGVPWAPIVAATTVHRYPSIGDVVDVDIDPVHVGDSSVELVYATTDAAGEPLATARLTHVVVGPDGGALPLPDGTRSAVEAALVERDPEVGPTDAAAPADRDSSEPGPSFSASFTVHSPHVEGVEWGYFAEYPRFAAVALEEYLASAGTGLRALRGDRQPFKPSAWRWEFGAPVPLESTLEVRCDVVAVGPHALRVEHEFVCDGTTSIEGVTEYGCFDRSGAPVDFEPAALAPFES